MSLSKDIQHTLSELERLFKGQISSKAQCRAIAKTVLGTLKPPIKALNYCFSCQMLQGIFAHSIKKEKKSYQLRAFKINYTKSNPIDDHSNISSKRLQKQNFKPLGHYTCMQCGTSHLQTIQENILSHITLATILVA